MEKHGDEVHVDEEEASGGTKGHLVRYVLGASLFLAIAALSLIWITGALSVGDVEGEATVSGRIAEQDEGQNTDGIVLEEGDLAPSE